MKEENDEKQVKERVKSISIRTKIMYAMLLISLLSLITCTLINLISLTATKDFVVESNTEQGNTIAALSSDAMLELSVSNIINFAEVKADTVNLEMKKVADCIETLTDYCEELYSNPQHYGRIEYSHPNESTSDILCMQWVLAEGVDFDSVSDETYLLGNMKPLFDSMLASNPNICSLYVTTETGINMGYDTYPQEKPLTFDGRQSAWYVKARESNGLYISNAYFDSFGRGMCISMSYPIYTTGNRFVGVIGLDILISDLNNNILQTVVSESGYAMLFASDKSVVAAPDFTAGGDMYDLKRYLGEDYESIYLQITSGTSGVIETTLDESSVYVIFAPVEISDWVISIVLPKKDITNSAEVLKTTIETDTKKLADNINSLIVNVTIVLIAFFAVLIFLVVMLGRRLARKISLPITLLNDDIKKIGNGHLDYISQIKTGDEIEELSRSFENMTAELKKYITDFAIASAYKERVATELAVATQIQISVLPCSFPAFPDRTEFDIYATMTPAKEVGGDFYDFFMVDEDHLAVVMADVSGKGVPAALFMMTAKASIKDNVISGKSPAEAFTAANNALSENNDTMMFVTAFMGVLEISTGKFTYVNAGHNPPLIGKCDGSFSWIKAVPGCVLAVMPQMAYTEETLTMKKGDIFFAYTDGVTEALNPEKALYGDDRLIDTLNGENVPSELQPLLGLVARDIEVYADGAEQADDITMLALKFYGSN